MIARTESSRAARGRRLAAHRNQLTPWICLPAVRIGLRIERIVRSRTGHPQAERKDRPRAHRSLDVGRWTLDISAGATRVLKRVIDFTRTNSDDQHSRRTESAHHAAVCGAASFDRARATDPPSPLGTALSQALSRPRGHHFFLLCFRPPLWNSGAPGHARIREFHGCGRLVFRRGRRHSSPGPRPGKTRSKYAFSARRCSARKHHRHDRRVDVADPPVDRDEPKSLRRNTHRVFHFHGEQHRRRAPPGRPAVVSRLSERRPVLVGVATLLAPMVGYARCRARHLLCARQSAFSEETPLRRARKRVRARRKLALRWRDQFHFHARDSRCAHCRARGMARTDHAFNRGRCLPGYAAADSSRERIHFCTDQRSGVDLSRHLSER